MQDFYKIKRQGYFCKSAYESSIHKSKFAYESSIHKSIFAYESKIHKIGR